DKTEIRMLHRPCPDSTIYEDFDFSLDDESDKGNGSVTCSSSKPMGNGGSYRSENALSVFDGKDQAGLWQCKIKDNYTNDGGRLDSWSLEICTPAAEGAEGGELGYTTYAYDGQAIGSAPTAGNLTLVRNYSSISPDVTHDSQIKFDERGRVTQVTDANGHSTGSSYHPTYGYVQSVSNALGHTTTTVADPGSGVPLSLSDANGKVTTYEYDDYNRLTDIWLPTESTAGDASYQFDYYPDAAVPYVKTQQLQDAGSSHYLQSWAYVDGFGRSLQSQRASMTSGSRVLSSSYFNNLGQNEKVSSPYEIAGTAGSGYVAPVWTSLANYQQLHFDELGNVTKTETKSYSSVLFDSESEYDAWEQRHWDAGNNQVDYQYNGLGNLVEVTEHNSGNATYVTSYDYDLAGNLVQVTDDASNSTTMSYDLLGRKISMNDPDMGTWTYQYDAGGNLTGQRDGNNQWLYMSYDAGNRLTWRRMWNGSSMIVLAVYIYDAAGQKGLLSKTLTYGGAGTEVRYVSYDDRNRLTRQEWVVAPDTGGGAFRMDYAYNAANQRISQTYPGGNSGQ
ncbi:MAG: RHS repeat protein, partial [Gammaproteobacteria bacterium]|nr:RHS repeat protein [Gammaproteobacteria bacterium]